MRAVTEPNSCSSSVACIGIESSIPASFSASAFASASSCARRAAIWTLRDSISRSVPGVAFAASLRGSRKLRA